MKAELSQVTIRITLPESTPTRESFNIWINTHAETWGLTDSGSQLYFGLEDWNFISRIVTKVCEFAKALEAE